MAIVFHKVFSIVEFAKNDSLDAVQQKFRLNFSIEIPIRESISRWLKQFKETGSRLCSKEKA